MVPQPRIDASLRAHRAALEGQGLPAPTSYEDLGTVGPVAHYALVFPEPTPSPQHFRLLVDDLDGNGFYPAYLATRLVRGSVPVVSSLLVLPRTAAALPGALSPFLAGDNGAAVLRNDPDAAPSVAAELGRVLRVLSEHRFAAFGTRATAHGFAPERATWAEEWLARTHRRVEAARQRGTAIEPLFSALVGRIDALGGALETARQWSLVHGDLAPGSLTFHTRSGVALAGVTAWHGALAGDPLVDWARVVLLPGDLVRPIAAAYGEEALSALVDADGRARLAVYSLTAAVDLLVDAGSPARDLGNRARRIERAIREGERALAGGSLASLEGTARRPRDDDSDLLRLAVDLLGQDPPLHAHQEPAWTALATAALLARSLTGDVAAGWRQIAVELHTLLPTTHRPRVAPPLPDRDAWPARIVRRVLDHHAAHPALQFRSSLTATSALIHALDALHHRTSDASRAGFESTIEGVIAKETSAVDQRLGAPLALAHAVCGLAAARHLAGWIGADLDHTALHDQLAEAWEVAEIGLGAAAIPPLSAFVEHYSVVENQGGLPFPVAPVVLAVQALDPADLPASPATLLAAIGIAPPAQDPS